ncbi:putative toxin-antitoxin system toxin component, PIN family (plasmid) [Tistrella mobilis]|uniref:putative toxin-antitoxin system toxin component, PIN family n=1 Tax=Tistrella mobilis TaxID=171437 RepID=UPI003558BD20
MMSPRLVLDTNVLVSALLFRSASLAWLRTAWQSGSIRPLASRETVSELLRVLTYPKFGLTVADREDLLADYLPWCETVLIPVPPPAVPDCRDPFDQPFLVLALAGHATALLTGDRDLLVLADDVPIPILTAADMKTRLTITPEKR